MPNVKYSLRNINLLNILLIVAILIFTNYTILPLFNMSISYTLPRGKKPPVQKDEKIAESTVPSLTDYVMVAEDNLFHPDREIPAEKADSQPLEQPEFVLYGTLITDGVRVAYLEDIKAPHTTQGRGKRQVALHQGNTLSGFTLKEIESDRVVMVRGEERIIVSINDLRHQKDRKQSPATSTATRHPANKALIPPFQKNQRLPSSTATQKKPVSQMTHPNAPQKIDSFPRMQSGPEYNSQ